MFNHAFNKIYSGAYGTPPQGLGCLTKFHIMERKAYPSQKNLTQTMKVLCGNLPPE